ncbi:MAG: GHMP kinase [Desulfurococcaceae archaeon]
MVDEVVISAPSRLHFGIINPFIKNYRLYVSAGVAISKPRVLVLVRRDDSLFIRGSRASELMSVLKNFAVKYDLGGYIEILHTIPKHVGLGSTTQLLLSIAYGLSLVNRLDMSIEGMARELGLGSISGVGIHVFKHGGFVVDAGKKSGDDVPNLMFRIDFPSHWRFVVLIPKGRGLSGDEEKRIFDSKVDISENLVFKASFYLFHELIPALIDEDFEAFSRALANLQETVGEMFRNFQGGVFAEWCSEAVNVLRRMGIVGIGQSSWGPAVYGVVESKDDAYRIVDKIRECFNGIVFVAKPDNKGAKIERIA